MSLVALVDPDQRHGPYIQWSRTVKGRTVNKTLTPEQLEHDQPRIDNGRRRRGLAHQLEALSLHAMRTTEGWKRSIRPKALRELPSETG